MARVVVTQATNGVPSGEPAEVPPAFDGESTAEILERKAAAHQADGWIVEREAGQVHAWKQYGQPGDAAGRVDRFIRVI